VWSDELKLLIGLFQFSCTQTGTDHFWSVSVLPNSPRYHAGDLNWGYLTGHGESQEAAPYLHAHMAGAGGRCGIITQHCSEIFSVMLKMWVRLRM